MRLLSSASTRPLPMSPHLYLPPKRRWWPLFACLGAAGVCALALFGSSEQPDATGLRQTPLVHSFFKFRGFAGMSRHSKPAIAQSFSEGTRVPDAPALPDTAIENTPRRSDMAVKNVQTGPALAQMRTDIAEA